jgi:polysaccharide biosynthesis protein PslG
VQGFGQPDATAFARASDANVGLWRRQLSWSSIEPERPVGDCTKKCTHRYRWSTYDPVFRSAARRGVRILPILLASPRWANSRRTQYPPSSASAKRAFEHFAAAAARRYGPTGTLWREPPWSATRPAPTAVHAYDWQVWNEPNLPNYWNGVRAPRVSEYAAMLKGVSGALNGVTSSVRVVAAGVPWSSAAVQKPPAYVADLVRVPGVVAATDAFAAHPYSANVDTSRGGGVLGLTSDFREALNRHGASRKALWLTEIGWPSGGSTWSWVANERHQAAKLRAVYRELVVRRSSWNLRGAVWFCYRDVAKSRTSNAWYHHTGLFRVNDTPKPAWGALKSGARYGF